MKILRSLGAIAVLCLLAAPAISESIAKGCTCMPGACHESQKMNCCGKSPNEFFTQTCACPSQISLYSTEVCDTGDSYFKKSSSRPYTRPSPLAGSLRSGNVSTCSGAFSANFNDIGPPDLDVVEYLPPSAKQVFKVLASYGPLTQKDLIGKTDLPPRTVRYALSRLKGEDMLEERFCFRDARQSLYSLNGAASR